MRADLYLKLIKFYFEIINNNLSVVKTFNIFASKIKILYFIMIIYELMYIYKKKID